MNALTLPTELFAPVPRAALLDLLTEYRNQREHIERMARFVAGDVGDVMPYFLHGNGKEARHLPHVNDLFRTKGAIAALNSAYWDRALAMTDVLDCMPQERRNTWHEAIRELKTPEFTEESVVPTIDQMLSSRAQFLAERVDGLFRALSRSHMTNISTGFRERMVLGWVFTEWGSVNTDRAGTINDLRAVISKFTGRDAPRWHITGGDLERCAKRRGQWHTFDGGALRIRVYPGTRTAHLEVHPSMADRLNCVLHTLHPQAIANDQRPRQARNVKAFPLLQRPLPFGVLDVLRNLSVDTEDTATIAYEHREAPGSCANAVAILEAMGGAAQDRYTVAFDFDPRAILDEVVLSGCLPDEQSHQFYPTPPQLADDLIALADIGPNDRCLEPSAGRGALADRMPRERTVCVEVAGLHHRILQAKGHNTVCADFLAWARTATQRFDRIVMNPPFSLQRWQQHLEAAADLLAPGGRLVAILPATARGSALHPHWPHRCSDVIADAFQGTGVRVVLAEIQRPL